VVSKNFYLDKKEKIRELREQGIEIKYLKNIKMHSKAILIDNKYLFI
jgi:phosphatidylserine/phosphatidylglycerophosphate/cardiolipin synthase-like enzyme